VPGSAGSFEDCSWDEGAGRAAAEDEVVGFGVGWLWPEVAGVQASFL
jgi:hypothetical protein